MLSWKVRGLLECKRYFFEVMLLVCSDAGFVLPDEPFSGMSPLYVEEIKTVIRDHSANKGLVLTDHNYRNILDVFSRVVLLHDGAMRKVSGLDDLRYWNYIP